MLEVGVAIVWYGLSRAVGYTYADLLGGAFYFVSQYSPVSGWRLRKCRSPALLVAVISARHAHEPSI